jgi:pilus assembly protein CpaF
MMDLLIIYEDGRRERMQHAVPFTLGRGSECEARVPHWRIARRHLRVTKGLDGYQVEDLGSLYGTRVNGRKFSIHAPVVESDEFIMGPCLIRLFPVPRTAISPLGVAVEDICPEDAKTNEQRTQLSNNAFSDLRRELHAGLIKAFDLRRNDIAALSENALRDQAMQCVSALLDDHVSPIVGDQRRELIDLVVDEAIGLGVLEPMLADPLITEIMVNRYDEIFIERHGRIEPSHAQFSGEQAVRGVIERIVFPLGRRLDDAAPTVDARLRDGSRINAVIPPIAIRGASMTIRKFTNRGIDLDGLVKNKTLSFELAQFLRLCVRQRMNILVSGGTGSGKTTLLNVLASCVPVDQRIVTIEDSAELQINHPHVMSLEARPENAEGRGAVSLRALVRNALRMRPDRIVVGEVRGPEAIDMLAAMNTGHEGSLTTLHANTPRDALSRLETMILSANAGLPLSAIREQMSSAISLIVQQARLPDGRRVVHDVAEIVGLESGCIQMQTLVSFDRQSGLATPLALMPQCFEHWRSEVDSMLLHWFASA